MSQLRDSFRVWMFNGPAHRRPGLTQDVARTRLPEGKNGWVAAGRLPAGYGEKHRDGQPEYIDHCLLIP